MGEGDGGGGRKGGKANSFLECRRFSFDIPSFHSLVSTEIKPLCYDVIIARLSEILEPSENWAATLKCGLDVA